MICKHMVWIVIHDLCDLFLESYSVSWLSIFRKNLLSEALSLLRSKPVWRSWCLLYCRMGCHASFFVKDTLGWFDWYVADCSWPGSIQPTCTPACMKGLTIADVVTWMKGKVICRGFNFRRQVEDRSGENSFQLVSVCYRKIINIIKTGYLGCCWLCFYLFALNWKSSDKRHNSNA